MHRWAGPALGSWRAFLAGAAAGLAIGAGLTVLAVTTIRPLSIADRLEPGELVILSGRDDSVGQQRNQLIGTWNAIHPHNQARIVPFPQAANGQHAEMINRAGADPDVDIFNLDVAWTAEFAAKGLIRRIDESRLAEPADRSFMANPLATCRYGNGLWALPFNTDAGLLYYRSDLGITPAPEPPFSWDELTDVTRAALARPGATFAAGYTGQLNLYEGLTVNALEAVWAADQDLTIDAEQRVSLDVKGWTEAIKRLKPASGSEPPVVLPQSLTYEETSSREAFAEGRVVFMRNWPVAYRALSSTETAAPGTPPVQFGVTNLPGPSTLGGQNLAISKRTKQPRAAQALIAFLTGEQSQLLLFERGGFAATRSEIYDDDAIRQRYPYLTVLRDAVNGARLRPASPHYVRFSEVLSAEVYALLSGETTELPPDLADRLTAALRGR